MKYEAHIYQMTVEDHTFWVADSKVLKGCTGQGETSEEAIKELEMNEDDWLETAAEVGIPIPSPAAQVPFPYKGKIALRVSPDVHENAAANAQELGISLNQYLNNAITGYNATVNSYLRKPIPGFTYSTSRENIIQFPVNYSNSEPKIILDEPEEM